MAVKVLTLFNPDKYLVRNSASEAEFKREFFEEYDEIFNSFDDAFNKMLTERSRLNPDEMNCRWNSNRVNGFLYAELKSRPEIARFLTKKNNTFYMIRGGFKLSFKKVDNKFRPSYNHTKHSRMLEHNRTESVEDDSAIVYIGYQVDDTWSILSGVYAISRTNDALNWVISLGEESLGNTKEVVLPNNPIAPIKNNELPELKLSLKRKINKEKTKTS